MLKVENLQYGYPGGPEVLKDISFTLGEGQFMAILGNNGAGKSTMLKCFNQILTPKKGSISLNNEEILKLSAREMAKRIAFVAQSVPNMKMTVHDMVMLGRKPYMKWGVTEKDHEMVHEAMDKLKNSRVAVFGVGGVGGYVCEALARSGVGTFDLIDDDKVCLTNLNRQIIATRKTVGKYKVEVMKERILDINPDAQVNVHQCFFLPENADDFPFDEYDYVVDAVDTVTAKIEIIMQAQKYGTQVISSMGAGNKLDPAAFQVADIYKTKMCPLAKVMRRELKKRGVKKLKVVYSEEKPTRPIEDMSISCRTNCICPPGAEHKCTERRDIPGSVAFVPSVAGLIIAGEVVKDIAGK